MSQAQHDEQCRFLAKCEDAYHLVQNFLNDKLFETERDPPYVVRQQRRQIVKEKVKKSLEVLNMALENHRYVKFKLLQEREKVQVVDNENYLVNPTISFWRGSHDTNESASRK